MVVLSCEKIQREWHKWRDDGVCEGHMVVGGNSPIHELVFRKP